MIDTDRLDFEFQKLFIAQFQHKLALDALLRKESARAEILMREHAYLGVHYPDVLSQEQNEAQQYIGSKNTRTVQSVLTYSKKASHPSSYL